MNGNTAQELVWRFGGGDNREPIDIEGWDPCERPYALGHQKRHSMITGGVAKAAVTEGRDLGVEQSRSRRHLYLTTGVGLAIGFGGFWIPVAPLARFLTAHFALNQVTLWVVFDVVRRSATVAAMLALVLAWEHRPLRSIGIGRLRAADFTTGFGVFLLSEIAMYAGRRMVSASSGDQDAMLSAIPLWGVLAVAFANGIGEELVARGFAIERLDEISGKVWLAAAIPFTAEVALHIPFWGLRNTIVIGFGLVPYIAFYVWRRNLAPCVIGHVLSDAFPVSIFRLLPILPLALQTTLPYDYQAWLLARRGDPAGAVAMLNREVESNPRDAWAYEARSLLFRSEGKTDDALRDLNRAIEAEPNSANGHYARAELLFALGKYRDALADADKAVALQPRTHSHFALPWAGRYRALRARLETLLGYYERAGKDFSGAIQVEVSDATLYSGRADIEYMANDTAAEIGDRQKATELDPRNSSYWSQLSNAYFRESDYTNALNAENRALAISPDDAPGYSYRARIYVIQKKPELALSDISRAIDLEPHDNEWYLERAAIRLDAGDEPGALSDVNKAIASGDEHALIAGAEMYIKSGHDSDAIAQLNKVIQNAGPTLEVSRAYNDLAWIMATSADPKVRDGRRAVELASKACHEPLKRREYADTLAAAYAEKGDFDDAVDAEKSALKLADRPGMKSSDASIAEMRARLDLYEHRQPYRQRK